jgi:hypothetical protein
VPVAGVDSVRLLSRVLLALVGLLVAVAAFLWIGVPPLISPTAAPPVANQPPAGWLAQSLRPAFGGGLQLRLTQPVASDLLAQAVAPANGPAAGPLYAAGVRFGAGSLTLQLFGNLPTHIPIPGWSGVPFQLDLTVQPAVMPNGAVQLVVRGVRVGRIPLTALIPPARLLRWLAGRVPAGAVPGLTLQGDAVVLDPSALPPLSLPGAPEITLRLQPRGVQLSPGTLALTFSAHGQFVATPAEFSALLSQWLGPGSPAQLPPPIFASGAMVLSLPAPDGAYVSYTVVPSVPQPGVLQLAVPAGGGALGLASWLDGALGGPPPWLHLVQGAVDVDFAGPSPLTGALAGVAALPTAARVADGALEVQFRLAAAAQ